ncbi:MerR family transcriptional regulator [Actinomycetaceae bacterium L2_0104]
MLTIGQLAAYAGVTIATVRHYHKVGLLPEPPRDYSGYRRYDADAVVRLIRIHVLASAGVPLARVETLLDAAPDEFAASVRQIDERLRNEARRIQATRKRLAQLTTGDTLALPESVVGYLNRLRRLGVDERYIEHERDAWIMVAAQLPDQIDDMMRGKHRDLDDPDMVRLYELFSQAFDFTPGDPRLVEAADILDRVLTRAADAGELNVDSFDEAFIELMDTTMEQSAPAATELLELLAERGWTGWTHFQRQGD